jgi:hypothetical protein
MYNFAELVQSNYNPTKITNLSKAAYDTSFWALQNLNVDLYDNQIEIVEAVTDLSNKYLAILCARGSGKSYAVAVVLAKLCLDYPGLSVGIFAPKEEQANRIIKEELIGHLLVPSSPCYQFIDWSNTSGSHIRFKNGSDILSLSASEQTQQEGYHFAVVVIDEAHSVSDASIATRIAGMLGTKKISKLIKLGVAVGRNHFWKSCAAPNTAFKVIVKDWTQCPILLNQGSITYQGMELPKEVIDKMPITLKRQYFPDRPDLHYDSVLGMTELDFNSHYAMIWENDANLVLNEENQIRLTSGDFEVLERAQKEKMERYFFGLDTASGSILPGKKDLDFNALSIWRKTHDNICQKVASFEWQGIAPLQLIDEIEHIVHPETGLFPCVAGCVDYSNIAITLDDIFKRDKIPVVPITYSMKEEITGKNYKNAMFNQFVFELECGRVQYPKLEKFQQNKAFNKSYQEWCLIERHQRQGINDTIEAPSMDFHDDHPNADVLAVWAATRAETYRGAFVTKPITTPIGGPASVASRGIPNPNDPNLRSRYLQ